MRKRLGFLFSFVLSFMCCSAAQADGHSSDSFNAVPRDVTIHMELLDLISIDSVQQSFVANLYYEMVWHDESMAHNGPATKVMDLDQIWHPNIHILNQWDLQFTLPAKATVFQDGRVFYQQRASGTFSQPLELGKFPFDSQSIELTLVSAGFLSEELNIIIEESSGVVPELSLPDWSVTEWSIQSDTVSSGLKGINWDRVVLSVEVERHAGFYLLKILLPLVLIVFMSWAVFWLDPSQVGAQISVSITAMLTLIAFRFSMTSMLPSISTLTKLDWFLTHSTLLIFLGLMEVVYTSWLATSGELARARRIDRLSRWIFLLLFVLAVLHSFVWN